MEQELDLIQYWEVLKKRWKVIVILPLIAALTSGIVSFFVLKPVYEASTTLIVGKKSSDPNQNSQLLDYNVLLANQQLAKTYATIAKSRTVEENVIKDLRLNLTYENLDKNIVVDSLKNTEVLEIKVTNTDPELAASIANATSAQFSRSVIEIKKVDSVSVVDSAVAPLNPIKPKKLLNILIAFVVGLMTAVGLAFLLEYLDNTIKDSQDVENVLGLPVLGIIPNYELDDQN